MAFRPSYSLPSVALPMLGLLFLLLWLCYRYWNMLLNPNDPMSAEVEGCVSAMDLKARVIASKTGYWADNWFQLTLPNYV